MGLLDDGITLLNRLEESAAGVSVTYIRGAQTLDITAVVGRTAFAQTAPSPGGASLIIGDRDYLIDVADLTWGEPAEGDRIEQTVNEVDCVFELMRPDTGEPAWRFSDPTRTKYRLHMKQVA